jgi:hypothetical protein
MAMHKYMQVHTETALFVMLVEESVIALQERSNQYFTEPVFYS